MTPWNCWTDYNAFDMSDVVEYNANYYVSNDEKYAIRQVLENIIQFLNEVHMFVLFPTLAFVFLH